ncbi:MAG: AAA family ATPase [Candidatus Thalassarchaeaceae archaeon]|nr:AAA family ATPase [Candidatus Thalassarchaeaceae archaeon]
MISESQSRILSHLSGFGNDLESAWDVPRGLCLPGIAEAVGVVRSAVHTPLSELETAGYVTTRSAHVIGTGARRRKVAHITQKGREAATSQPHPPSRRGRAHGPLPDPVRLHGRDDEVEGLHDSLSGGTNVLLNGLPGIGKTSLARKVAGGLLDAGWTVRWATCSTDSDASSVASMWLGASAPSSPGAVAASVDSGRTLLVLDEAQQLSPRHIGSIESLLGECSSSEASLLAVVRAPNPFGPLPGFTEHRLDGIEAREAAPLLPDDLGEEEALGVARSLGGHPLALRLWAPEDVLPEQVEAVQSYVESTVIERLSGQGSGTLDELCLSPLPLSVDEMFEPEGAIELDESAILRWSHSTAEPHHLIRNVRRGTWSDASASEMHAEMAARWASREGTRARRMEAHHRMGADDLDVDWALEQIPVIARDDSAAAAVLIEQAVGASDDEGLLEFAADIALERGETSIAESHIQNLKEGPRRHLRVARLARMEGDSKRAEDSERIALEGLEPGDRARAEVAALVRVYDDRLPGALDPALAARIVAGIDSTSLSGLGPEDLGVAQLALDLLRHAVALDTGDLAAAASSRSSLERNLGGDDPRLATLDLRARLAARAGGNAPSEAIEAARDHVGSSDDALDRLRTIHMALEASTGDYPEWLRQAHSAESVTSLREEYSAHRRAIAQWWYWRGVLEPENRLSSWREAIGRLRSAECNNAAKELTAMLAREI